MTQPVASGLIAHGALLTKLTAEESNVPSPAFARAGVGQQSQEPAKEPASFAWPTQFATVNLLADEQKLVLLPEQLVSNDDGPGALRRRFTSMDALVYYAPANVTDIVSAAHSSRRVRPRARPVRPSRSRRLTPSPVSHGSSSCIAAATTICRSISPTSRERTSGSVQWRVSPTRTSSPSRPTAPATSARPPTRPCSTRRTVRVRSSASSSTVRSATTTGTPPPPTRS